MNNIYVKAIENSYSTDEFRQLFLTLPIDVNQSIMHSVSIGCGPEHFCQDTLLHIAAEKHEKDIFEFLISQGADTTTLSHDGKTLMEVIQNGINWKKHWPEDVPKLQAMLKILESKPSFSHSSQC